MNAFLYNSANFLMQIDILKHRVKLVYTGNSGFKFIRNIILVQMLRILTHEKNISGK